MRHGRNDWTEAQKKADQIPLPLTDAEREIRASSNVQRVLFVDEELDASDDPIFSDAPIDEYDDRIIRSAIESTPEPSWDMWTGLDDWSLSSNSASLDSQSDDDTFDDEKVWGDGSPWNHTFDSDLKDSRPKKRRRLN